ncbi:9378_t:CDS:2, partial [Dentiscutata heterogama]
MLSNKKVAASDSQVSFIYSIQQSSQLTLSNEILPTFSSQVPSIYPIQQNLQYTLGYPNEKSLQPMLSNEALPIFGSQALSVYPNKHSLPNDEILLAFDSQVLSIYSIKQSSQPMLSDEILLASSSQVSFIYSIQQECASPESNMSNTNDIDNRSVNYDISDVNKQQNVEFKNQEKLEIVPGLVFQNWEQLDRYIRIYAKQNEKSEIDFYKNLDDFPATNVNEIISSLSTFSIQEIWEITYKSLISQPSITYQNESAISTSNFIPDFTLIYLGSDFSFNILKTLNNRHIYRVTNGFCKKAIAVGLDAGSVAMESLNNEIQDNELSDLDDQENVSQFDVSTIQDLVIRKRKGAPRVKRIKSSLETKNIQSNTKKEKATRFCFR